YSTQSGKAIKLSAYKLPPWINDYSRDQYPLLEYEENTGLLVTKPRKGKIYAGESIVTGIDGLTSIQSAGPGSYLLSGYRKGQSDLVSYDANSEQYRAHTSDAWDDILLSKNTATNLCFISSRPYENPDDTTAQPFAKGIYTIKGEKI